MNTHFGILEDCGDYEIPALFCEKTLCGYTSDAVTESTSDDWADVDCKKCL